MNEPSTVLSRRELVVWSLMLTLAGLGLFLYTGRVVCLCVTMWGFYLLGRSVR